MYRISTERHQKALEYAMSIIENSPVNKYISAIWLYGSCARDEQELHSDVDLLVELDISGEKLHDIRYDVLYLKGMASPPAATAPEVDIKIALKRRWMKENSFFYNNVRKDGKLLRLREKKEED